MSLHKLINLGENAYFCQELDNKIDSWICEPDWFEPPVIQTQTNNLKPVSTKTGNMGKQQAGLFPTTMKSSANGLIINMFYVDGLT